MSVLIKICGLKTPDALDVALAAGADLVGFVFFAPSPRHVGFEAARTLGERVRGRARKVALSVDAVDDVAGGVQVALTLTFEVDGASKPSCVATVVYRYYE